MGVIGNQSGVVASAFADGSVASAVVFPVPYDVLPVGAQVTPVVQSPQTELSAQVVAGSLTLTGFSFIVTGGAPGSTTPAYWVATAATGSTGGVSQTPYTVTGGPYIINVPTGNGGSNVYTFATGDYLGNQPTRYAIAVQYGIPLH
jgi:hypothetical protein